MLPADAAAPEIFVPILATVPPIAPIPPIELKAPPALVNIPPALPALLTKSPNLPPVTLLRSLDINPLPPPIELPIDSAASLLDSSISSRVLSERLRPSLSAFLKNAPIAAKLEAMVSKKCSRFLSSRSFFISLDELIIPSPSSLLAIPLKIPVLGFEETDSTFPLLVFFQLDFIVESVFIFLRIQSSTSTVDLLNFSIFL